MQRGISERNPGDRTYADGGSPGRSIDEGEDACKSGSAEAGWVQSRGWESIAQIEVLRGRVRKDTGLVGSELQPGLTRRDCAEW